MTQKRVPYIFIFFVLIIILMLFMASIIEAKTKNTDGVEPIASSLDFSIILGGENDDFIDSIAVNKNGEIYVSGVTYSSDFPTTPGAYNTDLDGGAFVAKIDATGSHLEYSTLIGIAASGQDIAVDADGNAYVIGITSCLYEFPISVNAYDNECSGRYEVYAAKLSADGSSLLYSTFLGEAGGDSGTDNGESIVVDDSGHAYAAIASDCGVMITKLNTDGSDTIYSTCVGGEGWEEPNDIEIDQMNNVYVTGATTSKDFPVTSDVYDSTFNGDYRSGYVLKLDSEGVIVYSTFVGGNGGAEGTVGEGVDIDGAGNVYVVGDRGFDGFIEKLDSSGTNLLYSMPTQRGVIRDLSVNDAGDAYLSGMTSNENYPVTENAYDATYNGNVDVIITILDPTGDIAYSTFIGGNKSDSSYGVTVRDGSVYVSGWTDRADFPITNEATPNGGGGIEAYVLKLSPTFPPPNPQYVISGNVADISNHALCSASISIVGVGNITTDANGNYRSSGLPAGNYEVKVSLTGYVFSDSPTQADLTLGDKEINFLGERIVPIARTGKAEVDFRSTYSIDQPVTGIVSISNHSYAQQDYLVSFKVIGDSDIFFQELVSIESLECFASKQLHYDFGRLPEGEYQVQVEIGLPTGEIEDVVKHEFRISSCTTIQNTPKPLVVLVHGCCGGSGRSFRDWPLYLAKDGYPVYIIDEPNGKVKLWPPYSDKEPLDIEACDPLPSFNDRLLPQDEVIEISALNLRSLIEDAKHRANKVDEKVILITHSKGGLISRAYIESNLYKNDVSQLIMLGTPNQGSPLANAAIGKCIIDVEICELTPEFMIEFNNLYYHREPNVHYSLIAGDVPASPNDPFGYLIVGPDDIVVPVDSVHSLNSFNSNISYFIRYNARHYSVRPLVFPTYMTRSTYDDCIKPLLEKTESLTCADLLVASTTNILSTGLDESQYTQIGSMKSSVINNQIYTHSVAIDNVIPSFFSVLSLRGKSDVSLINPVGDRITPKRAEQELTVQFSEESLFDGLITLATYFITDTVVGDWTIEVQGMNDNNREVSFTSAAYIQSDLRIQVTSRQIRYQVGARPNITATIFSNGTISEPKVIATVWKPDFTSYQVELYDDGLHSDGERNDGIFSNVGNSLDVAGYYLVSVDITGLSGGANFSRSDQTSLIVDSPGIDLTDNYFDFIGKSSNIKKRSHLMIMAEVQVKKNGKYALTAEIVDKEGNIIRSKANQVILQTGMQFIPLSFDGQVLHSNQVNGPYILSNIHIFDATTPQLLLAASKVNAWKTQPYEYSQFEATIPIFLPLVQN